MVIHSSPRELIRSSDHPLWWMVDRQYFASDILACGASAYSQFNDIPKPIRGACGGTRRYSHFMEALHDLFRKEYGALSKPVKGQYRFFIPGPGNSQIQVALRRGCPAADGFDASGFETPRYGAATEQLSLVSESSFRWTTEDIPSEIGLLLLHDQGPVPGHMQMWMAHEWRARRREEFIWCEESAYLGSILFSARESTGREPVGDAPEL